MYNLNIMLTCYRRVVCLKLYHWRLKHIFSELQFMQNCSVLHCYNKRFIAFLCLDLVALFTM